MMRILKLISCLAVVSVSAVMAQPNAHVEYHQPLRHDAPPGLAAGWMNATRQYDPSWLQPVAIEAPEGAQIEVFAGSRVPVATSHSPTSVAVSVGHLYRLRVSQMKDFPGVEIFPTIEIVDRLHPPAGREDEFPIPVIITKNDVIAAINGELTTRVVYLEQPQLAQIVDPLRRDIPQAVTPSENALREADRLGRPMIIVRVGGRVPTAASPPDFFGNGGFAELRSAPASQQPAPLKAALPPAGQRQATYRLRNAAPAASRTVGTARMTTWQTEQSNSFR